MRADGLACTCWPQVAVVAALAANVEELRGDAVSLTAERDSFATTAAGWCGTTAWQSRCSQDSAHCTCSAFSGSNVSTQELLDVCVC